MVTLLQAVGLNGLPLNTYISMYARTNRCYNERGSRTSYFRYNITHIVCVCVCVFFYLFITQHAPLHNNITCFT